MPDLTAPVTADHPSTPTPLNRLLWGTAFIIAVLLILFTIAQIWLMYAGDWIPIDEMVFGDISRMITKGYPMFSRMWDIKPPVTHYFVAVFILAFGNTVLTLRLASTVVMLWTIAVTTALVWQLTRARGVTLLTLLGSAVYAAWSAHIEGFNPVVMMAAFTTTAALLAVLARGRVWLLVLSGVCLALSFFSKPVMVLEAFAVIALAAYYSVPQQRIRSAVAVIVGGLAGTGAILFWAWSNGVLNSLWLNAFYNGFLYSFEVNNPERNMGAQFAEFFQRYFVGDTLPFILPLVGLAIPAALSLLRQPRYRALTWIVLGWCIAALIGAFIGRSMRRTYFVELVPPFLLLNALAVLAYGQLRACWRVGLLALLLVCLVQSEILGRFDQTMTQWLNTPWRSPDDAPAVAKARPTADFLAAHLPEDGCVWQWDGFGLVTYLADRLPCQSAFATQPLMVAESFDYRRHRMEYMNEIIAAQPSIHTRDYTWGYFPELERLAGRYVKELLFSGVVDVLAVDWSSWHAADVTFGDFDMIGYDLYQPTTLCAGDVIQTSMTWRLNQQPQRTSNLFVQVLTPDFAERIAGIDARPHSDLPITAWDYPNMIYLSDMFEVTLPPDMPAGAYVLVTGFYDTETFAPLTPLDAAGNALPNALVPLTNLTVRDCAGE